jgi:hypothetical protein
MRNKRVAIAEQLALELPCDVSLCVFAQEITDAIEEKHRIKFIVKKIPKIELFKKKLPRIDIVPKDKLKIEIKKKL